MMKMTKIGVAVLAVAVQLSFAVSSEAAVYVYKQETLSLMSAAKDRPGISELEYQASLDKENKRYEEAVKRRPDESDEDWKLRKKAEKQRHEKIVNDIKRTSKGKK